MNKSQRISIDPNTPSTDNHIIIKLDQEIDTLEFLSMTLGVNDVYQNFNADYGVLIGRVTANDGIGIENAKISIFIPLSDTDANIGEIASIYPYVNPTDKNNDGKRYNLLPRVAQIEQTTGEYKPKQPFGSFPIKPELVTNLEFLDVYKKYYKYTALTNSAGDYMIFGAPIGTQTVHLSVDITDIGKYSMNPAAMVRNLGYSPNLFTDNGSKIKPSTDLGDLPNIETQEISVDIAPFWGDIANFTIGITRQDFRIRATLVNTFTIFGSSFTDGSDAMWGDNIDTGGKSLDELFRARDDANTTVGIFSKRIGIISEEIYYYPPNITDIDIENGNVKDDGSDMLVLDKTQYSSYKRDGDFALLISCNRNKVITDEQGNEVSIDYNSTNGIFTEFRGFVIFEIKSDDVPMNFTGNIGDKTTLVPFRMKLKFPQYAPMAHSFGVPNNINPPLDLNTSDTKVWRKEHFKFQANKIYSVSRFHPTVFHSSTNSDNNDKIRFFTHDGINTPYGEDPFYNSGIIVTDDYQDYVNSSAQFPTNTHVKDNLSAFGSNWINLSIYFPQIGYLNRGFSSVYYVRSTDLFQYQYASGAHGGTDNHNNRFYYQNNTQVIAAGELNTIWMARSDIHWTDFIEVPILDIKKMANLTTKGFTNENITSGLTSNKYRNGTYIPDGWSAPCPFAYDGSGIHSSGRINGDPTKGEDLKTYFYSGFDTSDCIEYLFELGLVT